MWVNSANILVGYLDVSCLMLGVMFCSWIRIMIYESHHMWGAVVCSVMVISSVFFGYLTQDNSSRLYVCLCNCFGGCQIVCMLLLLCALMDVLCTSVRYWLSIEQTSSDILMKLRDYLSLQNGVDAVLLTTPIILKKGKLSDTFIVNSLLPYLKVYAGFSTSAFFFFCGSSGY